MAGISPGGVKGLELELQIGSYVAQALLRVSAGLLWRSELVAATPGLYLRELLSVLRRL